jgi:putative oxidoreductase
VRWLFDTDEAWGLTLLRCVLGVVFLAHGAQKLLGWYGGTGPGGFVHAMGRMGIPAFFAWLSIVAEFFGALGLILGLLTRVAAFGIGVDMIVAVLLVHTRNGFFMNWMGTQRGEGYEYHLLAIAACACLVAEGAGALSFDRTIALRSWRRAAARPVRRAPEPLPT